MLLCYCMLLTHVQFSFSPTDLLGTGIPNNVTNPSGQLLDSKKSDIQHQTGTATGLPDIVDWVVDSSTFPKMTPSSTDDSSHHVLAWLGLHVKRTSGVPKTRTRRGNIANWVILGPVVEFLKKYRFQFRGGYWKVALTGLPDKPDVNVPLEKMSHTQYFGSELHCLRIQRKVEKFFTEMFRKGLNEFRYVLLNDIEKMQAFQISMDLFSRRLLGVSLG